MTTMRNRFFSQKDKIAALVYCDNPRENEFEGYAIIIIDPNSNSPINKFFHESTDELVFKHYWNYIQSWGKEISLQDFLVGINVKMLDISNSVKQIIE